MYLVNFNNKNLHIIGNMSMRSVTFNSRILSCVKWS